MVTFPEENLNVSLNCEELRNTQNNQLSVDENKQVSFPSEVMYSWKPQETDPNLHPSKLISSVPVNRIPSQGSIQRNKH